MTVTFCYMLSHVVTLIFWWSREIGEIREEDERRTRREREIPQALVSISQQSVRSRM